MRLNIPPATFAVAGITGIASVVFWLTQLQEWAIFALGFVPARMAAGAASAPDMAPALLTPLTATLVHGGGPHLGGNLMMLLVTGGLTERVLGWKNTLLTYVGGAYGAAIVQWALDPGSVDPMIGASGAISAWIGAQAALYGPLRAKTIGPLQGRAVQIAWQIAAWTAINLLGEGVARRAGFPMAWGAHVGGFITGILMARPLLFIELRSGRLKMGQG